MTLRVALFVGTVLVIGACVQIAGIDDPHPKDGGPGGGPNMGQDAGEDADAGPIPTLDPEWANWPMPNPPEAGVPYPADYAVDMAQGLVTDNVTNLIWQQNIATTPIAQDQAIAYCKGLTYGGFMDGWRLPTVIELVSLVDFTKPAPGPTIDENAFPNTPQDWFWTATPVVSDPNSAWMVNFNSGKTGSNLMVDAFRVRCVR